jgi:endogenous inhibitor of DNA gyrase (YacG/DUF329 family)
VDRTDPAARPFCSERCKLIDLGAWASGRYAVPGERVDKDEGEPEGGGEPEADDDAPGRDRKNDGH